MYRDQPYIQKPQNEDVTIWRYLDLTKFLSLIDRRALYFCRADKLDDPFEGSYPRANVVLRPEWYKEIPYDKVKIGLTQFLKIQRKWTVINCWHMNECESAAMWRLYLKGDEGVAVRSTFKRLAESFRNYTENDVYIGIVRYIDYNSEFVSERFPITAFFTKRKSFEHERELRALIHRIPTNEALKSGDHLYMLDPTLDLCDHGLCISVELEVLVEKIFVSPSAPGWFADLVRAVTRKYDLGKDVIQSSLSEDPVF